MGNCLCRRSRAKEEETQETQQKEVKESGVGEGSPEPDEKA
ncbi:hypothetical protein SLEP1_g47720 [Rubroshorea leprosula]|uniref:Uncharacterized protein n=1 Tax=Rubroshorea leprosula TaxID=152421 RepID=A0AAV5LRI4_9ROSI|nr:hypothetical protein SLEP1_g47720 [Rubroshorea leprosula]